MRRSPRNYFGSASEVSEALDSDEETDLSSEDDSLQDPTDEWAGFRVALASGNGAGPLKNRPVLARRVESPAQSANILSKLQDTRQYIDELVEENQAFASMVDILRILHHWKEVVRSEAAIERAVHASTVLQGTQAATRCVLVWRLTACLDKHAREQQSTREEEEVLGMRRMERVACVICRRVRRRTVLHCYRAWGAEVTAQNRRATCTDLMSRRTTKRDVSHSFKTWRALAVTGAGLQKAAHRAIQRGVMLRMKVSMKRWIRRWRIQTAFRLLLIRFRRKQSCTFAKAAFDIWKEVASLHRSARVEGARAEQCAERMLFRRCHFMILCAMQKWREHCVEKSRTIFSAGKVIMRRRRSTAMPILLAWSSYTQKRKHSASLCLRVVSKMLITASSKAFCRWTQYAGGRRIRQIVAERIARRSRRKCLNRAYQQWLRIKHDQQQTALCVGWWKSHQFRRRLALHFYGWMAVATARRKERLGQESEAAADLHKMEMAHQVEFGVQEIQHLREWVDKLRSQTILRLEVFAKCVRVKDLGVGLHYHAVTRLLLSWSASEWHRVARETAEHDASVIRSYQLTWSGLAFHAWIGWLANRKKFRVVAGRLVRRMQFGLRKMLKGWHMVSWQGARLRVAAAKIHRHRNWMSSRKALDAWRLWIEMMVMSSRLKAAAERNLISRAFFEWFEVNGHADQYSALSSVSLFREQFSEMLDSTPQHSTYSGARPASTPRNL